MKSPFPMPRTRFEATFGSFWSRALAWLNALLAVGATVLFWGAVFVEDPAATGLGAMVPVLIAIPVLWWVVTGFLFAVVHRHRTRPDAVHAARDTEPRGILVRGSRLLPIAIWIAAVSMTAFCLVVAFTVGGGWAIFWLVCAAAFAVATFSSGLSALRPRRLVLHVNGVGSASYFSDASVQWGDVERIDFTEGMAGIMVLRVTVRPDATTFREHWRHPFLRRRGSFDIEPLTLGLDGTMLWLALRLYATDVPARQELVSGRPPARLFDPAVATAVSQAVAHPVLDVFRPVAPR